MCNIISPSCRNKLPKTQWFFSFFLLVWMHECAHQSWFEQLLNFGLVESTHNISWARIKNGELSSTLNDTRSALQFTKQFNYTHGKSCPTKKNADDDDDDGRIWKVFSNHHTWSGFSFCFSQQFIKSRQLTLQYWDKLKSKLINWNESEKEHFSPVKNFIELWILRLSQF